MSDDVMVSKVILQEQRGNFLLSDVKEEPRDSTPTPSTCSDNSHIPVSFLWQLSLVTFIHVLV